MTETDLYTMEGYIELHSGVQFHFGRITTKEIFIEDIAKALPRLCRYNGHTRRWYSVAEHVCIMADWVKQNGGTHQEALTALHHDDAEYIIGDLPRPIKVTMPQFKELETRLDEAIAARFGTIYPFPPWLKEIDARILKDERAAVMNKNDNKWGTDDLEPLGVEFMPLRGRSTHLMTREFLKRHWAWYQPELVNRIHQHDAEFRGGGGGGIFPG